MVYLFIRYFVSRIVNFGIPEFRYICFTVLFFLSRFIAVLAYLGWAIYKKGKRSEEISTLKRDVHTSIQATPAAKAAVGLLSARNL